MIRLIYRRYLYFDQNHRVRISKGNISKSLECLKNLLLSRDVNTNRCPCQGRPCMSITFIFAKIYNTKVMLKRRNNTNIYIYVCMYACMYKYIYIYVPTTLAMESPTPMAAYAKDMTAAIIERNESLWKLGIWLSISCMAAYIIMKGYWEGLQSASCPYLWKQFDLFTALFSYIKKNSLFQ